MKNKIIRKIKCMFGICCFTGCYNKSVGVLEISTVGVKTEICNKHILEITKYATEVEIEYENGNKVKLEQGV